MRISDWSSDVCSSDLRMVTVEEDEIKAAMRHYFTDTHNVAEGAGAAALAALLNARERMQGKRVGMILSGGHIDRPLYISAERRVGKEGGRTGNSRGSPYP